MLVKFDSEVGSFTMNGEIAVQLLKAMGHSGTIPSAILSADIPQALDRLQSIVNASPNAEPALPDSDEKAGDILVSLRQRAFPLIDLLMRAAEQGAEVMWRK